MTKPSQTLPPWFSQGLVTITQDGVEVVQTTVVEVPQTYFGPSIPLGPGWVFGGSTSPVSIATSLPTVAAVGGFTLNLAPSITSPSSIISTSIHTSASAPTTASTFTSSSLTSTFIPTSSISSVPSPIIATTTHDLSSNTRLAVILSTTLGLLLVIVSSFVVFMVVRRRRAVLGLSRNSYPDRGGPSRHRNNGSWVGTIEEGEGQVLLSEKIGMEHDRMNPWSTQLDPRGSLDPSSKDTETWFVARGFGTDASHLPPPRFLSADGNRSYSTFGDDFPFPTAENVKRGSLEKSETQSAVTVVATALKSLPPDARNTGTLSSSHEHPDRAMILKIDTSASMENSRGNVIFSPIASDEQPRLSSSSSFPDDRQSHAESLPSEADESASLIAARDVGQSSRLKLYPVNTPTPEHWNTTYEDPPKSASTTWRNFAALRGLSGLAGGLDRLSWFKGMDYGADPSTIQETGGGDKPESDDNGSSVYHTTYTRPRSPVYVSTPVEASIPGRFPSVIVNLSVPPSQDLPISERHKTVLSDPVSTSSQTIQSSSGLINIPLWDKNSRNTSRQDEDTSEETHSQSHSDWSSTKSKNSHGEHGTTKRHMPAIREGEPEQHVQIVPLESRPRSKYVSLLSGGIPRVEAGSTPLHSSTLPLPSDFSTFPPVSVEEPSEHHYHRTGSSSLRGSSPPRLSHATSDERDAENYGSRSG